jgi:hypothetical protein
MAEPTIIPAQDGLLELALAWWVVHMRRPVDNITAVGLDGRGVLHFVWQDDETMPYELPLIDLHRWNLTGVRTTTRSL